MLNVWVDVVRPFGLGAQQIGLVLGEKNESLGFG
jgi:hypothetical protein